MEKDRTDWVLVLLIWGAGLGAAAQYGKISVIFDRLPQIYPDAGASLGFAVSLVGSLGIVLGVIAGVLVARIGYRRAILTALAVGAATSCLQALFPPFPLFLATRVIEGATHLAIVVAAPTLIAQICAEKDRGAALTLWGTFFGVAFAVLAWGGIALADAFGLPALMLAHGVYMAVMAGLLWPVLPRILTQAAAPPRMGELLRAHRRIYLNARIGAPAWGWLCYTFCFVSVLTVLPPFLPPEYRALVIGAMPLMSILGSMTLGVWLLGRIGAVMVSVAGFVLCAAMSLLLLIFAGHPGVAIALGATLGLVQGAGFAAVAQLNTELADRALANGGLAQMGNLGNTLGTPIMVAIIASFGYPGLMLMLTAVFLTGAGLHLWLNYRRAAS